MKNVFIKLIALFGLTALLFSSCNKGGLDAQKQKPKGTVTVELKHGNGFVYFSFAEGKQLDLKKGQTPGDKDWDVAFSNINGKTNPAGAAMETMYTDFDGVKSVAPFLGKAQDYLWKKNMVHKVYSMATMPPVVVEDSFNPYLTHWYHFEGMSIVVSDKVYIIKTADGDYVKLKFIDWKGKKDGWGDIQFKYEYIGKTGINKAVDGEVIIEKHTPGKLEEELKSFKSIKYLTINSGDFNDDDVQAVKKLKQPLELLDLSRISFAFENEDKGFKDCKTIKKLILPATLTTTGGNWPWFGYMSNLNEVIFSGNSLESVSDNAFTMCPNLETVVFPNSVEVLSEKVFFGCKKLKYVVLPSNITDIPNEFFFNCRELETIRIPASVKRFTTSALCYCKKLNKIIFEGKNPPEISYKPYNGLEDLTWDDKETNKPVLKFYVPKGSLDSYIKAFGFQDDAKPYFVEY